MRRAAAGACAESVRLFVPTFFGLVFHWAAGCRSLSLAKERFHLGLARTRWLCVCDGRSAPPFLPLPPYLWLQPQALHTRCSPLLHSRQSCVFFSSYFGTKRFPQSNLTCAGSEGVLLLHPGCSDVTCSSRRRVRDENKCNVSNVIFDNGLTLSF